MSLPTHFTKMAGGGNDFLVFEADGRFLDMEDRRRLALICRRGLSVGADGALFFARRDRHVRLTISPTADTPPSAPTAPLRRATRFATSWRR
jgi:hypothetical protein